MEEFQLDDGRRVTRIPEGGCGLCVFRVNGGAGCSKHEHPVVADIACVMRQFVLIGTDSSTLAKGETYTSDGKYIRFPKRGCPGCCFTNATGIGCEKPAGYPICCSSHSDESYQYRPVGNSPVVLEKLAGKIYPSLGDCIKVPCKDCTGCVYGSLDTAEGCHHPDRDGIGSNCGSFSNPEAVIFKLKSDYTMAETPKKKVYPSPGDCVKIPCETCEGCVFGNMRTGEDCHYPDRTCGASHNPTSMIYILKTDDRAKSTLSWDNGRHYMIAGCGCTGCCFNTNCSRLKPDDYPECNATDSPLKVSSQYRKHENPCSEITSPIFEEEEIEEDPENLDTEWYLDDGGVVRGIREIGGKSNSCRGCYFNRDGGICIKDELLDEDPSCVGIIFECIEDPPKSGVYDEDDEEDEECKPGIIVTDKHGIRYEAFAYEGTCKFCAFLSAEGGCKMAEYFYKEPECGSVIFKRVDELTVGSHDKIDTVELIFKKEVKFDL